MNEVDQNLLEASNNNDISEIETYLQEGGNVNCRGIFETPLINAVRKGNYDVAKFLVENGADVNLQTFGTTPLIETILFGQKKVFDGKTLKNHFGSGYYKILKLLLENGADFQIKDGDEKDGVYHIIEIGLLDELGDLLNQYLPDNEYIIKTIQDIQEDKMMRKAVADAFSPVER